MTRMLTKAVSLFLLLTMLFECIPVLAEGTFGEWQYHVLEDGTAEITGYMGTETEIVIPAFVKSYAVTAIGDRAFRMSNITSVTFPEGIKSIGDYAFLRCGITSVTLPEGLETIGFNAFNACKLDAVELPETLISIGQGAFAYNNLTEITLPGSLVNLGGTNCFGRNIAKISVSPENPYWEVIDGLLYHKEDACLFLCPDGLGLTECAISDGTLAIGENAFRGNKTLTSVLIPEGVTTIGSSAFYSCRALTNVILPNSLTDIEEDAFEGTSIQTIALPDSLVRLGDTAFRDSLLTEITLPASLEEVGVNPFTRCERLRQINVAEENTRLHVLNGMLIDMSDGRLISSPLDQGVEWDEMLDEAYSLVCEIPEGTVVIGAYAFNNAWITDLIIPEGVTEIEDDAFEECHWLSEVAFPSSLRTIGEDSFSCCGLTSLALPEGVVQIGQGAFSGNDFLESVTLPASLLEIDATAFEYCDEIAEIIISPDNPYFAVVEGTIINTVEGRLVCVPWALRTDRYTVPGNVTSIGFEVFLGQCDSPCEIVVPEGVTTLEERSFAYCTNVDIWLPASLTEIAKDAFYDQGGGGPLLHVVPGSYAETFCQENGLRYDNEPV